MHAVVAAFVTSAMADASFSARMAAQRFDLDFVPVARDEYFLRSTPPR